MRATAALLLVWGLLWAGVQAEVLQAMQQSWRFDFYDDSGNITTFPVYEQCQSMRVKWGRSSATGPSATAPYSFLIYTSIYQFPFFLDVGNGLSYDFEIPFPPGTQICMFDANGYTGGCQSVVSIVPNTTTFSHTCTNKTLSWPEGPLDVEAGDNQGPLSWTAWPEQCSDLQFTPKNGTPPYTLQVAPASHPPYNTTLNDMSTFNWTVALTWATPFFVSIVDADYNLWSIGMLHSGDGKASCLGGPTVTKVSTGAAAGAGIGGLVLGLTLGALATWFFLKRHRSKRTSLSSSNEPFAAHDPPYTHDYPSPGLTAGYFDQRQSHVDPYSPTGMTGVGSGNGMSSPTHGVTSPTHGVASPSGGMTQAGGSSMLAYPGTTSAYPQTTTSTTSRHHAPDSTGSDGGLQSGHNVYVLHHDGGAAPVTVFHGDDTQVVELPPLYAGDREVEGDARHRSMADLRNSSRTASRTDLRSSSRTDLRSSGQLEESEGFDPGFDEQSRRHEVGNRESFSPRMLVDQRRPVGVRKPTGPR